MMGVQVLGFWFVRCAQVMLSVMVLSMLWACHIEPLHAEAFCDTARLNPCASAC